MATLVLKRGCLPQGRRHSGHGFSVGDTVTGTIAFKLLVCAVSKFTRRRQVSCVTVRVIVLIVMNVCCIHQRLKRSSPLLPLSLLGVPVFALSVDASVYSFATRVLTVISLPFFLRGALKRDRIVANLLLAP